VVRLADPRQRLSNARRGHCAPSPLDPDRQRAPAPGARYSSGTPALHRPAKDARDLGTASTPLVHEIDHTRVGRKS
jgi:hypothetical protein